MFLGCLQGSRPCELQYAAAASVSTRRDVAAFACASGTSSSRMRLATAAASGAMARARSAVRVAAWAACSARPAISAETSERMSASCSASLAAAATRSAKSAARTASRHAFRSSSTVGSFMLSMVPVDATVPTAVDATRFQACKTRGPPCTGGRCPAYGTPASTAAPCNVGHKPLPSASGHGHCGPAGVGASDVAVRCRVLPGGGDVLRRSPGAGGRFSWMREAGLFGGSGLKPRPPGAVHGPGVLLAG
jgi:hypothetical protein